MIVRHLRFDKDRTLRGELKQFQNELEQIDWRGSFHQPGNKTVEQSTVSSF